MPRGARQNAPRRTTKCPEAHSLISYVNLHNILTEESLFSYEMRPFKKIFFRIGASLQYFFVSLRRKRRLSDKTGGMVQALFSFRNIGLT